jgi:hypothetical protein
LFTQLSSGLREQTPQTWADLGKRLAANLLVTDHRKFKWPARLLGFTLRSAGWTSWRSVNEKLLLVVPKSQWKESGADLEAPRMEAHMLKTNNGVFDIASVCGEKWGTSLPRIR